ncbi:MAG: hypothetical protein ACK56F_24515, partial [bacterium]
GELVFIFLLMFMICNGGIPGRGMVQRGAGGTGDQLIFSNGTGGNPGRGLVQRGARGTNDQLFYSLLAMARE